MSNLETNLISKYTFETIESPGYDESGDNNGTLLYDAQVADSGGRTNVLVLSGLYEPHTYNEYNYGVPQLAGASVVTIGRQEDLNNHDSLTVACFARMTGKSSATLISINWRSGHTGHLHRIYEENGNAYFQSKWVEFGTNTIYSFETALDASHDFSSWHHYVVVKDGFEWKHYVDGVLVGTHTHTGSSSGIDPYEQPNHEGFGETSLGGSPGGNPDYMDINRAPHIRTQENAWWDTLEGALDNVLIWARSLDQSEVQTLYNNNGLEESPEGENNMAIKKLALDQATIAGDGTLSGDDNWAVDFDELAPSGSYSIDNGSEQLVLTANNASGDGQSYNFKASLPEINPGGSIVLKLDSWIFGPNAGLGTSPGSGTRLNDTMAVESCSFVLQEYETDSLDNADNQVFVSLSALRNVVGANDDWNDIVFDVVRTYDGLAGDPWRGTEDAAGDHLGVFNGATSPWGLHWWDKRVVAAHWNHSNANDKANLHTTLANMGSPYSGGSISGDAAYEAYNKLIQQFYGYYRFSAPDANTMEMHYSPDGSTWYLIFTESGFNIANRMGLHFWCRLSDSEVRFSNIIADPDNVIDDVADAIAQSQGENNMSYKFKIAGVAFADNWPSEQALSVWDDAAKGTLIWTGVLNQVDQVGIEPVWVLTGVDPATLSGAYFELEDALDDGMLAFDDPASQPVTFQVLDSDDNVAIESDVFSHGGGVHGYLSGAQDGDFIKGFITPDLSAFVGVELEGASEEDEDDADVPPPGGAVTRTRILGSEAVNMLLESSESGESYATLQEALDAGVGKGDLMSPMFDPAYFQVDLSVADIDSIDAPGTPVNYGYIMQKETDRDASVEAIRAALQADVDTNETTAAQATVDEAAARVSGDAAERAFALAARDANEAARDESVEAIRSALQEDVDANESAAATDRAAIRTELATEVSDLLGDAGAGYATLGLLEDKIQAEEGRVDAILEAAYADKDNFKAVVDLINSVDLENDDALGAAVTSLNDSIAAEAARAKEAEASIQADVDTNETTAAQAMVDEVSARTAADAAERAFALAARDANESARDASIAAAKVLADQAIVDAKAIADAERATDNQAMVDGDAAERAFALAARQEMKSELDADIESLSEDLSDEAAARVSGDAAERAFALAARDANEAARDASIAAAKVLADQAIVDAKAIADAERATDNQAMVDGDAAERAFALAARDANEAARDESVEAIRSALQEDVDQNQADAEDAMSAEIARAKAAEASLEAGIEDLEQAAAEARQEMKSELDDDIGEVAEALSDETSQRIDADTAAATDRAAIRTELASEVSDLLGDAGAGYATLGLLEDKIQVEEGRVDAILEAAYADKDNFKAIVDLINSVDLENDDALGAAVTSLNDAIAAEATRAKLAEASLETQHGDHVSAYNTKMGVLEEIDAAATADRAAIRTELATEVSDLLGDAGEGYATLGLLEDKIQAEAERATGREDEVAAALASYEAANDAALAAEVASRGAADDALQAALNTEIGLRETLEGEFDQYVVDNDAALAAEVASRGAADDALQAALNTEIGLRETLEGEFDQHVIDITAATTTAAADALAQRNVLRADIALLAGRQFTQVETMTQDYGINTMIPWEVAKSAVEEVTFVTLNGMMLTEGVDWAIAQNVDGDQIGIHFAIPRYAGDRVIIRGLDVIAPSGDE